MADTKIKASTGSSDNRILAALGYVIGLVAIIAYFAEKDKETRFHALQAILLWVSVFVIYILVIIIGPILAFIPVIGVALTWILWIIDTLVWLGALILGIYLAIKTYQGEKIVLPVIGRIAEEHA